MLGTLLQASTFGLVLCFWSYQYTAARLCCGCRRHATHISRHCMRSAQVGVRELPNLS